MGSNIIEGVAFEIKEDLHWHLLSAPKNIEMSHLTKHCPCASKAFHTKSRWRCIRKAWLWRRAGPGSYEPVGGELKYKFEICGRLRWLAVNLNSLSEGEPWEKPLTKWMSSWPFPRLSNFSSFLIDSFIFDLWRSTAVEMKSSFSALFGSRISKRGIISEFHDWNKITEEIKIIKNNE